MQRIQEYNLTVKKKEALIAQLGADYLFNIEFNEAIMTMSPDDFIETLLMDKFKAREVFCGFNYRFGFKKPPETCLFSGRKEKNLVLEV